MKGKGVYLKGVDFTASEWRLALLVSQSLPTKEAAARANLTVGTAKVYLSHIYRKMLAVHPEIRQSDIRSVLTGWVRCYLCEENAHAQMDPCPPQD